MPEKNDTQGTRPFDVTQLLAWAARDTDEADVGYLDTPALHALCDSLAATPQLHFLGRSRAQKLLLANLIKRVRLRQYLGRHPEIGDIELKRPVFLVAPPRTGTTFLHRLLAEDPAVRAPRLWETLQPPPAEPKHRGDDAYFEQDYRVAMARKAIGARKRFTPNLPTIHPSSPNLPEECYGLLETTLLSHSFMFYGPVTSYLDWLDQRTHEEWVDAYREYADQLRLLQWWYPGEFWVLKTPFHLWAVDAIFEVFPDAVVVQQYRDATRCVASYCSLSAEAYKPCMLNVDLLQVGQQALRYLGDAVARNVAARAKLPAERFIDIDFPDLMADPMACAERIYALTGRELSARARDAMTAYLAQQASSHKKDGHQYSLEDYGLEPDAVKAAFAAYNAMAG
ncbi:MAG: sulfotransferase [Pseudomonadota bacterium]